MDTLSRVGTDIGPGGGDENVDIVDVSPTSAGGVKHLAALQFNILIDDNLEMINASVIQVFPRFETLNTDICEFLLIPFHILQPSMSGLSWSDVYVCS